MRTRNVLGVGVLLLAASISAGQGPEDGTALTQLPMPPPRTDGVIIPEAERGVLVDPSMAPTMEPSYSPPPGPRFWMGAEYLLWWVKGSPMPPVVTTAPANSPAFFPGALGNPDTQFVMGGRSLDYPVRSGARFTAGYWLDPAQTLGVQASYFFLGDRSANQFAASDATATVLTNPFLAMGPRGPSFETANYLAQSPTPGAALLSGTSRFQGAELNAVRTMLITGSARLLLLGGFRYLKLDEGLALGTIQTDPTASFFPGQFVQTLDQFRTQNDFYGGQFGARIDIIRGNFFLQGGAKLAMGSTHEVVQTQGYTTTNTGPNFASQIPTTTVPGGIYTQPTNIGQLSADHFAVAPEVTLQGGVALTRNVRLSIGYNFLCLSDVARPGNQVDRAINPTQLTSFTGVPSGPLVGPARPAPQFNASGFWAQGMNFGLQYNW